MPATVDILREPSRLFRAPVARGIAPDAQIDPEGGAYGAGLIRQVAVITAGEALGHQMWIDRIMLEQVCDAINASSAGIKSRFAHPGLSGDGLGKALGRVRNATLDRDIVRADEHLYESAHETPDGDLAAYILKLAAEDPAAFGTSISFDPDDDAEAQFADQHFDEKGRFVSPDEANTHNYPHVRVAELVAVDMVDEPAANPDGLFHRGDRVAFDADAAIAYALGVTDDAPAEIMFGVSTSRVRGAVLRFLEARGLTLFDARKARARARELELTEAIGGYATIKQGR